VIEGKTMFKEIRASSNGNPVGSFNNTDELVSNIGDAFLNAVMPRLSPEIKEVYYKDLQLAKEAFILCFGYEPYLELYEIKTQDEIVYCPGEPYAGGLVLPVFYRQEIRIAYKYTTREYEFHKGKYIKYLKILSAKSLGG
jgi:hypothetical protein